MLYKRKCAPIILILLFFNRKAVLFGGGGHAQAAGCTIHAPLQEALDQMLAAMKNKLDKTPRPEKRA